ncbi:hypothetical protein AAGF08_12565 [Algoriphagus sp. SE2]|uniref:hypothetical protein n=1 Tax=Algoriphagus sp. SE2 TaxID=3141536 RepID=UPI0031CD8297
MKQLQEEFESNLQQLDIKVELRENIMSKAAEVLDYIDTEKDISKDTLLQKMSIILIAPTFDPIQNDILQSDKIQLISNSRLRRMLGNWPSYVTELKEQETEWVNLYSGYTAPYLIDIWLSRDLNIYFFDDPRNLNYLMDKSNSPRINLKPSKNTPSVKEILNDVKLEGILSSAILINVGVNVESQSLRSKILDILESRDSEIVTKENPNL